MLENLYQTTRGHLSESNFLHSSNIFISFLHLHSSPISIFLHSYIPVRLSVCVWYTNFSNSFVSTTILPFPSFLSSLFICLSQCLTPSLARLPETTYACKLATPYIICPIVIEFYTNCDIFIASRRPQSNTYQCARLYLVNVRAPERHIPIRFVQKKIFDVYRSLHRNMKFIEITNKMRPCSRIYYFNVS